MGEGALTVRREHTGGICMKSERSKGPPLFQEEVGFQVARACSYARFLLDRSLEAPSAASEG